MELCLPVVVSNLHVPLSAGNVVKMVTPRYKSTFSEYQGLKAFHNGYKSAFSIAFVQYFSDHQISSSWMIIQIQICYPGPSGSTSFPGSLIFSPPGGEVARGFLSCLFWSNLSREEAKRRSASLNLVPRVSLLPAKSSLFWWCFWREEERPWERGWRVASSSVKERRNKKENLWDQGLDMQVMRINW